MKRGALDRGRAGSRPEGAAGEWGDVLATEGAGGEHGSNGHGDRSAAG